MYQDTRISLLECKCKQIELGGIVYLLNDSVTVSRGSSCLVYDAWQMDTEGRHRRILLKEFYPLSEGCAGWRQEDGSLLLPDGLQSRIDRFLNSYEKCKELFNEDTLNQYIVQVQSCPKDNGTAYMVVDYSSGITMEKYMLSCSLFDFFKTMRNLAGVLGALHGSRNQSRKGYVHMDIKPGNILVLSVNPEHLETRELCRLLDTDSFIHKESIHYEWGLSGTPGYTAPEVIAISEASDNFLLKEDFREIGERADMYSFGAVIHEYIFEGELPKAPYESCHYSEDWLETCLRKKFKYIPYKAISLILNLLKKTLAKDPYDRYESMSEIEEEIGKILKLINNKKVQILDNCHRNSDKILGREQKILELRQKLTDPALQDDSGRVVIVTGIGGIGKSSLAREYAAVYAEDYDIKTETSGASMREAVIGIKFYNDPTDGIQDQNVLFEKRRGLIMNLCREQRTLLVVNDYDTSDEPDDKWNELGCDVILTSRHEWNSRKYPTLSLMCNDLSPENARAIFMSYYLQNVGVLERNNLERALQKEENNLWELLQYLDYHPFALKLSALQMTFVPGEVMLPAAMLKSLKKEGIKADSLIEFQHTKESQVPSTNVHGHLTALYRTAFFNGCLRSEDREALRYMTLVVSNMGISTKRFIQWTNLSAIHLQRLKSMGWLEYLPLQEDLLDGTKGRGVYVSVWPEDPKKIRQYEVEKGTYVMPFVIQEALHGEPDLVCTVANSRKFVRSVVDFEGKNGFTAVRNALYEQKQQLLRCLAEEHTEEYAHLLMEASELMVSVIMGHNSDEYTQALSMYQKSFEILKELPDTYDYQKLCVSRIIYFYGCLGNFEDAYNLLAEMIDEHTKLGLGIDLYNLYQMHTMCLMEFHAGKMYKAIYDMEQLLKLHMEMKERDLFAIASIFVELGQMLRQVGWWQRAEKMLLEADKRFIRLFCTEDGPLAIEMHNLILVERGILCLEAMEDGWAAGRFLHKALSLSQEFMQPTDLRVGDIHFYLAESRANGNPYMRSYVFEEVAKHRKLALDIYQKQLHPRSFKTLLTKFLLALDYGEVPGRETMRDALLSECDAEIFLVAPELGMGDPCGSFYRYTGIVARNAEENNVCSMFEVLEARRKLHLRLYGKDTSYLQECEALAKFCEKYGLPKKADHYRMIADWD